jgi:hypothetical protein
VVVLVEKKADDEIEDDEKNEDAVHYQVDANIRPVLPVEIFQSFKHIRNDLPEGNDSFFVLKNHNRVLPFVNAFHGQDSGADLRMLNG